MKNNIPLATVIAVWRRDAGLCQHPKCKGRGEEIHHIIFRSQGGTHETGNLVLLCSKHHEQTHDSEFWRRYWESWEPKNYILIL